MASFTVTYAITTPESAEDGEHAEIGTIGTELALRDAIDAVQSTRTNRVDGVECIEPDSSGFIRAAPWFVTVTNGMEYETGAYEQRTLHMPDSLTAATRRRIARMVGARI
jgi:hypothetical protein